MAAPSAKFKVVVQKPSGGVTFDLADGAYKIEREALDPIGAEIVEVAAKTEEEFIAAARDADAVIARNRRSTPPRGRFHAIRYYRPNFFLQCLKLFRCPCLYQSYHYHGPSCRLLIPR